MTSSLIMNHHYMTSFIYFRREEVGENPLPHEHFIHHPSGLKIKPKNPGKKMDKNGIKMDFRWKILFHFRHPKTATDSIRNTSIHFKLLQVISHDIIIYFNYLFRRQNGITEEEEEVENTPNSITDDDVIDDVTDIPIIPIPIPQTDNMIPPVAE